MVIILKGKKVVDVVKSVDLVENGLLVTKLNDSKVIYGNSSLFTQATITEIPENIDLNRLGDYEYENGTFTRVKFPVILKSELLSRLTEQELDNIANYQDTINSQSISEEEKIARLKLMNKIMLKFNSYQEVNLGHPDTTAFSQAVAYCELITAERVAEIIGA